MSCFGDKKPLRIIHVTSQKQRIAWLTELFKVRAWAHTSYFELGIDMIAWGCSYLPWVTVYLHKHLLWKDCLWWTCACTWASQKSFQTMKPQGSYFLISKPGQTPRYRLHQDFMCKQATLGAVYLTLANAGSVTSDTLPVIPVLVLYLWPSMQRTEPCTAYTEISQNESHNGLGWKGP